MRSSGRPPTSEFSPIAVVGRGCVLPGALTPEALRVAVEEGRDLLSGAAPGSWRVSPERVVPDRPGREGPLSRGGYVHGFDGAFDPTGFVLPPEAVLALDPALRWLLHAGRAALREAGHDGVRGAERVGAIVGSLLLPTIGFSRFAESVWFDGPEGISEIARLGEGAPDPRHRFMSGLPIRILANALQIEGRTLALDAACASSLYAIRLACEALQDGEADLMLAGAVNGTDPLFLHAGFRALQALSPTGRSRPFHREADGLVPAEGAVLFALKRLDDAVTAGDRIHGVIRGIGLSNDGGARGLLVPDPSGQERAMRAAFRESGLRPAEISLMECHATGTPVGDAAEIRSAGAVYEGLGDLPIGSLKSNLGHSLTASGAAGLLKVLGAMESEMRPASLHGEELIPELADSPFRLLRTAEPWPTSGLRRAAVSSFGFGGNNAHLLVEQWSGESGSTRRTNVAPRFPAAVESATPPRDQVASDRGIAIVALSVVAAGAAGVDAFARALLTSDPQLRVAPDGTPQGEIGPVGVVLPGLRFPPADLAEALPQQALLLEAARAAVAQAPPLPAGRTGVIVGMQCDAEVARHMARLRIQEWAPAWANERGVILPPEWTGDAAAAFAGPLTSPIVLGTLPNVVANRVSAQFGLEGPGFVVSDEELSGIRALEIAARALRAGEMDAAVVGAVDLSCEVVHRAAARTVLGGDQQIPGDAAVVMVLKRQADAERDADRILALLPGSPAPQSPSQLRLGTEEGALPLTPLFGHAHAASALLHVAAAVVCCDTGALPGREGAVPWLTDGEPRGCAVRVRSLEGATGEVFVQEAPAGSRRTGFREGQPRLSVLQAEDRAGLLRALETGESAGSGPARLAVAADTDELWEARIEGALAFLRGEVEALPEGVFLRDTPIEGELAFLFTGAGAAYPGMGRDLLASLPEVLAEVAQTIPRLRTAGGWAYAQGLREAAPLEKLTGSSLLAQFHARITQGILGLRPTAALGLSSGETNALAALGAWDDLDGLLEGLVETGMYSREVGGEFRALERAWGAPATWAGWRLLLPLETVEAAVASEPRVWVTMRQGLRDCVIGGEKEACDRVVAALRTEHAYPLGYDLAVHCPILEEVAESWRELHHRPTRSLPDVRFYSAGTSAPYRATADAVADALTGMARAPVDFPALVRRAWDDGVRVFVEHGPRDLCSRWVREALGDRPHLAVSLDRPGVPACRQLLYAAAELAAAGVSIHTEALVAALAPAAEQEESDAERPLLSLPAHARAVQLPSLPRGAVQAMDPAPALPSLMAEWNGMGAIADAPVRNGAGQWVRKPAALMPDSAVASALRDRVAAASAAHRTFLRTQSEVHQHFLRLRRMAAEQLTGGVSSGTTRSDLTPRAAPPGLVPPTIPVPGPVPAAVPVPPPAAPRTPAPPLFDRADLEHLASGRISDLFGPLFEAQDGYPRQVRMPMPPLLLADRVMEIEGEPGSMGIGRIVTETDLTWESWYLHEGRMPVGIQVEAGQADLLLCSWLGADLLNRGERVYRLLGCELTFHGSRPKPGETLHYDIRLDRHARTGEVRLFFFGYDCTVDGEPRLTVRGGHAGFFTDEELRTSGGVIWNPADEEAVPPTSLAPTPGFTSRRSFSKEQVQAFSEGNALACFGPGFEWAAPHVRSPRIQSGDMLLMDEVQEIDPQGGPWGRGYLRATRQIRPDDWFFPGHFKDDPTMPGTLMYEGGLQAMAFYLAAAGLTVERDGWRFEPVTDVPYAMVCRGQVLPTSHEIVYEIFVHGIEEGAEPILWADILLSADGLKAFHCRRMGLRLVPDWPLEARPELRPGAEATEVAASDGFAFGHDSLLHCAWGRPSLAFGPRFECFDSARMLPRLPGPPYHFMSRVTRISGEMGDIRAGTIIEVEYEIPPDAWYFEDTPGRTMPFAVLLEAALQPCGWLTAYMGIPLALDTDLRFRNLNGDGAILGEVRPGDGLLTTRVTCTDVSRSGETFIESFEVRCFVGDRPIFELKTAFGHFPPASLSQQVGVPFTEADRKAVEETPANVEIDLRATAASSSSARDTAVSFGPGRGRLAVLDRVTGYWPAGPGEGRTRLRAEMIVDPSAWFFRAHFFQDPVQPGSLGIEAMVQLLQFYAIERKLDLGIRNPRFESLAVDRPVSWRYRGQVTPVNRRVIVEAEIVAEGRDEGGAFVRADCWLWVDGKRIYSAKELAIRVVEGEAPTAKPAGMPPRVDAQTVDAHEFTLDPAVDRWLSDHRPTYTVPAVPLTFMTDWMATAALAGRDDLRVVAIRDLAVRGWLVCDGPRRLRTEVTRSPEDPEGEVRVQLLAWREASVASLSRFEPAAEARFRLAPDFARAPEELPPLPQAERAPDPYESCALIHGPAFHILRELHLGSAGSRALLDAGGGDTPPGTLHPLLLDAITHAIPNAELHLWSAEIPNDQVAYPMRIPRATFHGTTPRAGTVRCEVRFDGFDGDPRFPRFRVQMVAEGSVWADLDLVAGLHPKGPIGMLPGPARRDFLLHRRAVEGAGLSRTERGETRLLTGDIQASDWLPGTLARLYGTEARGRERAIRIAVQEHVGRKVGIHPGAIEVSESGEVATAAALPFTTFRVEVAATDDGVTVRDASPERADFSAARKYWQDRLGVARWPVEDMYFAMAEKFVRRVVVEDPEGFARIRGRSAVFVANHQVAVESFLFALLTPGLTGVPSVVLAKSEVRTRWLDEFLTLAEAYPGVRLPEFIIYLEQKNPIQVLRTFERCKEQMTREGLSALVHVEGTRSLSCRRPVTVISSSLIDMAMGADAPIVPVRFLGGLPIEPLETRRHIPLGHGSQDYHFGSPIFPEELAALPYAARREHVLRAINALGGGFERELPNPPDPAFEASVDEWMEATGTDEEYSILLRALQRLDGPGPEMEALLAAIPSGELHVPSGALGRWTADLAKRLFGKRGPKIVKGRRR